MVYKDKNGFFQTGRAPADGTDYGDVDVVDDDADEPMTEVSAAKASSSSATASGKEETRITLATPSYGLQETHTTILPFDFYFSLNWTTNGGRNGVLFKISMVNPIQPLVTSVTHVAETATSALGNAWYDRQIVSSRQTNWIANSNTFPEQYDPTGCCQWWNYWSKLYDSYTVLGTSWSLMMDNRSVQGFGDCLIAWLYETSTATDTTNVPPSPAGLTLEDVRRWENINYRIVEGRAKSFVDPFSDAVHTTPVGPDYNAPEVLSGHYRPGQGNRLVQNDQDTKTWHKVTEAPTLVENLDLYHFLAPLATGDKVQMNYHLQMKFIVQFKDLKQTIRYPYDSATPIAPAIPTDTKQATLAHT